MPLRPATPAMKLSGRPAQPNAGANADATAGSNAGAASNAAAPAIADAEAPTIARVGEPKLQASVDISTTNDAASTPANPATDDASAKQATADDPNAAKTAPEDPNVVHLKQAPDRETQRNLMAAHKRWIVDETPGSRQLFFGADGKFGWDDFLDVINPLQHIPIVAQIYRAVTGDEISGAAELIGSLPLGPVGVIGTMGAIADLAVKDTTGKDIGDNLTAMVFGDGKGGKSGGANPADTSDLAQATPAHPDLGMQTASAEGAGGLDAERMAHDQRKA